MEKVIKVWLKYYPVYLSGLWGTLWISAVTVLLGALLGMVVALMRMSRLKILRTVFNVYVEISGAPPSFSSCISSGSACPSWCPLN